MKIMQEDKETLRRERSAYKENRRSRNEIQELQTQVQKLGGTVENIIRPFRPILSPCCKDDN
jgi:hypothetical protein